MNLHNHLFLGKCYSCGVEYFTETQKCIEMIALHIFGRVTYSTQNSLICNPNSEISDLLMNLALQSTKKW